MAAFATAAGAMPRCRNVACLAARPLSRRRSIGCKLNCVIQGVLRWGLLSLLVGPARQGGLAEQHVAITTPLPVVSVNAIPITLYLQVNYEDEVFTKVSEFTEIFVNGMSETLGLDVSRLAIVRLRQCSNQEIARVTGGTVAPGEETEDPIVVEDRTVVEFRMLDPPEDIHGSRPTHTVQERANRLHGLLNAQSRSAWKGGLLKYITGSLMVAHPAEQVDVPEGQFDGTHDKYHSPIQQNFKAPGNCRCSAASLAPLDLKEGCAEHFNLSPGFEPKGTPWCVVIVECTDSLEGFGGYWNKCEEDLSDKGSGGRSRVTGEARRRCAITAAAPCFALLLVLTSFLFSAQPC